MCMCVRVRGGGGAVRVSELIQVLVAGPYKCHNPWICLCQSQFMASTVAKLTENVFFSDRIISPIKFHCDHFHVVQ